MKRLVSVFACGSPVAINTRHDRPTGDAHPLAMAGIRAFWALEEVAARRAPQKSAIFGARSQGCTRRPIRTPARTCNHLKLLFEAAA